MNKSREQLSKDIKVTLIHALRYKQTFKTEEGWINILTGELIKVMESDEAEDRK